MAVSLYTSRVVLITLGVEDFGLYNAVAGFVTMFAFLNSAMASATQRFLAFEIGQKNIFQLGNVFSMSVNIHLLIVIVILTFAETVGLWFLNTQLTIPAERMDAARWVYQFSILMLVVNMLSVPYNALIIAHERMNVFAWVSIAEVGLQLLIVFMLQWFGFDKLKLYAVLMFIVALVIRFIYGIYCNRKFKESHFRIFWDKPLFKTLLSYAGWNLWGSSAYVLMGQGINVLLNIFFGPVVNAAYGIAYRLQGAVNRFVHSFQMAINPAIVKAYAANDLGYMYQLVFFGAKYSYFLSFTLSLPLFLETDIILELWLSKVPEYTVVFSRLVLINTLINSISRPLMFAAQASGKIRLYQGVVGSLLLLNLPVSYWFLKIGYSPETTFLVAVVISIVLLFARLAIIRSLVKLRIREYLREVLLRIIPTTFVAVLIPLLIICFFPEGFNRFLLTLFSSLIMGCISIYFIGLKQLERIIVRRKIHELIRKVQL